MLILDDESTWPVEIAAQLEDSDVKALLLRNNTLNKNVLQHPSVMRVIADIELHARKVGISVYHCTKKLPGRRFKRTGLRVLDFQTHHDEFRKLMRRHPKVSKKLYKYIDQKLGTHTRQLGGIRQGRLFFCLTRKIALDDAGDLVRYYGGESIYFLFYDDEPPKVKKILRKLGKPVLVEALLMPDKIRSITENFIGPTLVGHYASTINKEFHNDHPDCWSESDIPPKDIVAVHRWRDL